MQGKRRETQVITVDSTGVISGLEHKNGVNLGILGDKHVTRASEILFNEDHDIQKWYIKFLIGSREGKIYRDDSGSIVYFDTYPDANAMEIKVLNDDRLSGVEVLTGA